MFFCFVVCDGAHQREALPLPSFHPGIFIKLIVGIQMHKTECHFQHVRLSFGYNTEHFAHRLCLQALCTGGVPTCQRQGGLPFHCSCPLLADWVSGDMMDAKCL